MKITCIAGLPGSGKTRLALTIAMDSYPEFRSAIIDDPKSLDDLPDDPLINYLVIADPHFCRTRTRFLAEEILLGKYGVKPTWIFFENDPEQCKANVIAREDDKNCMGMIRAMTAIYQIPQTAEYVRPVYRPVDTHTQ